MTEERDEKDSRRVSQKYRELGAEEPPRALDEAILAASRRGASARPTSVDRLNRQRWYGPLAAAAVIVLAVAMTLQIQFEQPDLEVPAPPAAKPAPPAAQAPAKAPAEIQPKAAAEPVKQKLEALARRAESRAFVPDPAPPAAPAPAAQPESRIQAPAGAPAPAASASGALAGAAGEREQREGPARDRARELSAVRSMAKRAEAPAQALAETPERELERIAELRRQGRHDEADKALAEFRKRYPDYKIPQSMLERVERR